MSTRTTLRPHAVITNGNMAANINSQVTILNSMTILGYGISWSGTSPVGTVLVQVSNDYQANNGTVINAGTWTPLELSVAGTLTTTIPVTGNSGTIFIDIAFTSAYAIQLVYTAGSGSGTLQATINGKVS